MVVDDNLVIGLTMLAVGWLIVLGLAKKETFLQGTENYAKDFGYLVFVLFMLAAAFTAVQIDSLNMAVGTASGLYYTLLIVAFVVFLLLAGFGLLRIVLVEIHKRVR